MLSGGHSSPSQLLRDLGRKGFSNLNDAAIVAVGISDYLDRKREKNKYGKFTLISKCPGPK